MKIFLWIIGIIATILGLIYVFGYWDAFVNNLTFLIIFIGAMIPAGIRYVWDSRCKECKKFFVVRCIDSEIVKEMHKSKDVKIKENGKEKYVRKVFRIQRIKEFCECKNCGYEFIRYKDKQEEI